MRVTLVWALTLNLMGSETARAPLGIEMDLEPEKVRCWRVSVRMAGDPAVLFTGRAMVAAVMGRLEAPSALLNWNRMVEASWVT